MKREVIEDRLRSSLRAALHEARSDPAFLQRIAKAVCEELNVDPLVGVYLASRLAQGVNSD